MGTGSVAFEAVELERWVARLLEAAGVPQDAAAEVARHLLFADLRGNASHGTGGLKTYLARLEAGGIDGAAEPAVLHETPVAALVDGRHGLGQVIGKMAADLATAKAARTGIGVVSVRNSNHCGCLAYHTDSIARRGLIGVAMTNAMAAMAPFGGTEPFFGTNPLSVAAPVVGAEPVILDMATSQTARGNILKAAREGADIPLGWAIDQNGEPTDNPVAALEGALLPIAGPKGSGLAFMIEMMTGLLSGGPVGPEIPPVEAAPSEPQRVGQFFFALNPGLFMAPEEFENRMAHLLELLHRVPGADPHGQVLAPGELERQRAAERPRPGIPLTAPHLAELRELAWRYEVPLPAARVCVVG